MNLSTTTSVPDDLQNGPEGRTLVSVLHERAQLHPGKTAFTFVVAGDNQDISITYGELDSRACKVAVRIAELGLKGKKVLMFYPAGLDFIVAFFGCLFSGAIPVPAYPPRKNRSLQRIHAIVTDSGAVSILTTTAIAKMLERNFLEDPVLKNLSWQATETWYGSVHGMHDFDEPGIDDLAFLQYTSGSTGTPKGVMVSHKNLMFNLRSLQEFFRITGDDVTVNWVPQFHDLGLIFGILETVFSGILSVLLSPVDFISNPFFMLSTIDRYRATITGQPDFAFNLCVDKTNEEQRKSLDLSSLKILYSGAEPIRKSTFERFLKAFAIKPEVLTPGYGMAESTLVLTVVGPGRPPFYLPVKASALEQNMIVPASDGDEDVRWITSNGKPKIDTELIIADPETCLPVPAGRVGEIWARGSTITMGYYNNPDLTEQVYKAGLAGQQNGDWLRSGDLGFIHEGELFITGRLKDLIIIHGRNFYPQDIEQVIEESHAAIRKTYSAAFSIEKNGEERLAVLAEVQRSFIKPDTSKIIEAIVAAISRDFEVQPARVTLIRTGSLPKTSSGKTMRRAAREALFAGNMDIIADRVFEEKEMVPLDPEGLESPSLEQFLVNWISHHLNDGLPVDPANSLAAYGIDSLRAVLLTDDTKSMFGFEWPPYLFFDEISISHLASEGMKLMQEK